MFYYCCKRWTAIQVEERGATITAIEAENATLTAE
jgi:hypothetical protein